MPLKDPDKRREYDRLRYLKNRDAIRDQQRLYTELNADKNRERVRRWAEENRARYREGARRRRSQRRGVPFTEGARQYAVLLSGDPCAYCGGVADSIDHITPVVGGGNSEWDNLAPSCKPCNSSKGRKSLLRFLLDTRRVA